MSGTKSEMEVMETQTSQTREASWDLSFLLRSGVMNLDYINVVTFL